MFCTNCGKELPENTNICNNCGAQQKIPTQNNTALDSVGQVQNSNNEPFNTLNSTQNNNFIHEYHSKPLTTTNFFFIQILFMIPIINLFFALYWSFKKNINKNLKSYARSNLIWIVITVVLTFFVLLTLLFMNLSSTNLKHFFIK